MSIAAQSFPPTVRPMQHADLTDVHAIEAQAYQFPWSDGVFRDCLLAGYFCCVLEHDLRVRGYAILSVAAGEAHILNLCVHPDYRRSGFARQLLHVLMTQAKTQRISRVLLEVRPTNAAAIALYEQHQFVQIGCRQNYYQALSGVREDALVLACDLR